MVISENIKKQNIILKAKSTDRWDLLAEMIDIAVKNKEIPAENRKSILAALVDREKSMTTGIGNGVAIPHCITEHVSDIIILFAIIPKGIDFDSIDNLPVNISILLIVPKNKKTQHIKTLAGIAKVMANVDLRHSLLSVKTAEGIISEIAKYE